MNLRSVARWSVCWVAAAVQMSVLPNVLVADDFGDQLKSVCRVVGTQLPLRVVAQRVRETHGVNIWLDRRVDPTTIVSLSAAAGSLEATLQAIGTKSDLEIGFCDPIVIVAPRGKAIDAATRILALRARLRSASGAASTRLLEDHDLAWDRLTTPAEIAQQIGQLWQTSVAAESLPHDLWDRKHLNSIDVVDALVLLAAGFDLSPSYDPQQSLFRFHPIEESVAAALDYPAAKVSATMVRELRKIDPNVKLARKGGLVRVTGNAAVHHRIRHRDGAGAAKPNGGLAGIDPRMRRFTLRIPGMKPAASILQAVCNASGLALETSDASPDALQTPVGLEVEDQLVTEIIESICVQAGLAVRFDSTTAVVSDRQ
ncbi:hypothetical protein [Rosistilla ulvae]|uniref:hypothetical protein n=1 Tax=Rosistilla ulvae TaxID=1930277 RepID=UPI00119CE923|nr:hypothetical protein [Rosistilla ulvae]